MVSGPMKALLGVLAVAGYQNRDKIGEMLRNLQNPQAKGPNGEPTGGLGGLLGGLTGGSGLGGLLGGSATGSILSGGIGDLLKHFQQNGHGETADSWVSPGPNTEINDHQLSDALGPEVIQDLSARTGLTREEILSRLSRDLPKAVDGLTPNGNIPTDDDRSSTSGSAAPSTKFGI